MPEEDKTQQPEAAQAAESVAEGSLLDEILEETNIKRSETEAYAMASARHAGTTRRRTGPLRRACPELVEGEARLVLFLGVVLIARTLFKILAFYPIGDGLNYVIQVTFDLTVTKTENPQTRFF